MTGATIILLEDDELARELYQAALECEDYQVICAPNSIVDPQNKTSD